MTLDVSISYNEGVPKVQRGSRHSREQGGEEENSPLAAGLPVKRKQWKAEQHNSDTRLRTHKIGNAQGDSNREKKRELQTALPFS